MAIGFTITNKDKSSSPVPDIIFEGKIGDEKFADKDPGSISPQEAQLAYEALMALQGTPETKFPSTHPLFTAGKRFEVKIGQATTTVDRLELIAYYENIQNIFQNDQVFAEWRAMVDQMPHITVSDLREYASALKMIKASMWPEEFSRLLTKSFAMDTDNIIVKVTPKFPGNEINWPSVDTYQGFVMDDISMQRLVNAIFNHGDDFGEEGKTAAGHDKIKAPYVACSKILQRYSANHVLQEIVLDIPFPGSDKMTLNDTWKKKYGGLGMEVSWDLPPEWRRKDGESKEVEERQQATQWSCLDGAGTTMLYNHGFHRLLPLSPTKTLYWYGTESDVQGLNAPGFKAKSALRDNMKAFAQAARTREYGEK